MSNPPNSNSRIVYSTEYGKMCPDCSKPLISCICSQLKKTIAPAATGPARVHYETQGRKGKGVTVISGLPLNEEKLTAFSKELKRKLGVGGTVKDLVIELQGDRREEVVKLLRVKGYSVK